MKINFKAVPTEAPWEIEQIIFESALIQEARIEETSNDYEDD